MTYDPDTLQAECPECAALFEGAARNRHLDEHLDREHSTWWTRSANAQDAADAADTPFEDDEGRPIDDDGKLLGTGSGLNYDKLVKRSEGTGCDAGDPCPHPNLQPRQHRYGGSLGACVVCGTFPCRDPLTDILITGPDDPEPPAERPDWNPA